jgi:hypothetical protein
VLFETQPRFRACTTGEEARQYTESLLNTKKILWTLFQSIEIELVHRSAGLAMGP